MRKVRPTSLRSIVWKGFTAGVPAVVTAAAVAKLPVTKGTFWPTTIFA